MLLSLTSNTSRSPLKITYDFKVWDKSSIKISADKHKK